VARFKIGEKLYSTASLDEVSLRDIIRFNTQAESLGIAERWHDVEVAAAEMASGTQAAAMAHPMRNVVIGVTIWASRLVAGEDVTFEQAVTFPVRELTMLPDPEDRKSGKAKGAKRAPAKKKTATRSGSGRAAEPRAQAQ
jgi:hypothetical protein